MINTITKAVAKIFGTKSEKDLKILLPFVPTINAQWELLKQVSDDDLRGRTTELRSRIATSLSGIDTQISDLQQQASHDSQIDLTIKEGIFVKIDKLEVERNKQLEQVLLDILPESFAIVKETARRYKENGGLNVVAQDIDRLAASRNLPVQIQGNMAFWPNKWMAAGSEIVWDMIHYDVQLIGGLVLHKGIISEMSTGEGKTLVATLPTFLNALAGRGVHIVTVNDYLAKRDSQWMAPLFEFHGITVDCIDQHQPNSPARRNAYLADITYGTNNEFGFDYLRDNMATNVEDLVQRKLHYAIVDEVDSVLIDDARTPLIISGPIVDGDRHEYDVFKPRIARLVDAQKLLINQLLLEAKRKIAAGDEKEGGLALFRAYRGLPKSKPLIKYLSEPGMKVILQKTENIYLADNSKAMPEADKVLYFVIDEKNNQIDLTEQGLDFITGEDQDKAFFIMPDLSMEISALEKNKSLDKTEIIRQKDKIIEDYTIKSGRIHTVQQILKAYTLFEKEVEYVIMDNKVKIVDEQTGRIMEGRRYSDGLHQAIEAKENVKVEDATQTYATITLQNYFRMYHKLSGMTGTAETEAGEFWQIYKLDVITIPTNQKIIRKDAQDKVYKTMREKFNAVVEEIGILTAKGQPVLVGTTSVENSELLSRMLKLRGISHKLLNAKYHQKEAEIVADAGRAGTVTIATNMAGRGTDIKLSPEARAAGGLAIIGTERHESRRVDRQLRGRSGRQGDPGSSQFFVSLEDGLMRLFGSDRMSRWMDKMGLKEGEVIQHSMITSSIEGAQKKVEQNNFAMRKRLLEYDDVMNSQRELIYKRRRNALFGQRLEVDILNMVYNCCDEIVSSTKPAAAHDEFSYKVFHYFGISEPVSQADFIALKPEQITLKLYQAAASAYTTKKENMRDQLLEMVKGISHLPDVENAMINFPITDGQKMIQLDSPYAQIIESQGALPVRYLESMSVISEIDNAWKEHLRDMDDLKQSVQQAVYEQKDPLVIYKFESFKLFKQFGGQLNLTLTEFLFKIHLASEQELAPYRAAASSQQRQAKPSPQPKAVKVQTSRPSEQTYANTQADEQDFIDQEPERLQPLRARVLPNRNDRVSVVYATGEVKKDVKFKTVEQDFLQNLCTLIED